FEMHHEREVAARQIGEAVEEDDGAPAFGAALEGDEAAFTLLDASHGAESVYGISSMPRLVLASSSVHRARQLARIGLEVERIAPELDEDAVKRAGLAPREVAESLARAKAEEIAPR